MKRHFLLPSAFRKAGWLMSIPFGVLSVYCWISFFWGSVFLTGMEETWLDEFAVVGLIVSLLFVAFSAEKQEDECVMHIRAQALAWSMWTTYIVFILATLFLYEESYLVFVFACMFVPLIVFIVKYQWDIHRFWRGRHE